ncbi:uncharacterized protein LOC113226459 isoform X2 [Hyposmocoma kahamanoa]|uniref:uncharacterized protein LOC113226459 isoform X2 n=1 Tax=Hyposmocoma kahamanoa TaxID=1477025 RepID=UPI000E6D9F30|nr:uncharacterized protein LOC113226459 isoform X2 [Hyposmocoma kahamanoa]
MKQLLVLFAVVIVVASVERKGGLRAKFAVGLGIGRDFFFEVPETISDAREQGWIREERPANQHLPTLQLYCANPTVLCVLYEPDTENAAGLQIGVNRDRFTGAPFDFAVQGWTEWISSSGVAYWTIAEYFVDEAYLEIDAQERIANRNSNSILQLDGIWVTGFNKEIYKIPGSSSDIEAAGFTKQLCMPWMGQHYYYNITKESECSAESIFPWFPLYDHGRLIGMGMNVFGHLERIDGERDWFEAPGRRGVEVIVNNGPQCLYDLAESADILTMHTYFVAKPQLVLCI